MVRTASSFRTGTTCFIAAWCRGANMNPKPISSMQRATSAGPRSIRTPSASSRSAEPQRLVLERLPCLATAQPAPAATSAAAVEMLNVEGRRRCPRCRPGRRGRPRPGRPAAASSAPARPARRPSRPWSAARPGRRRSAPRRPVPSMISSSTAEAWSAVRWVPGATASIARVRTSFGISVGSAAQAEEVSEYVLAAGRQHGLGVKLHALRRQLAVPHAHHHISERRGQLELRSGSSGSATSE